MYIVVLCVCNFIAEKLNVRQKPSVFGNASGTAIGMVGVHTIDVGPLGVFHAMAWSRFRRMRAKNRESAGVAHGQCVTVRVDQISELLNNGLDYSIVHYSCAVIILTAPWTIELKTLPN